MAGLAVIIRLLTSAATIYELAASERLRRIFETEFPERGCVHQYQPQHSRFFHGVHNYSALRLIWQTQPRSAQTSVPAIRKRAPGMERI
jgi:hypothetical protein